MRRTYCTHILYLCLLAGVLHINWCHARPNANNGVGNPFSDMLKTSTNTNNDKNTDTKKRRPRPPLMEKPNLVKEKTTNDDKSNDKPSTSSTDGSKTSNRRMFNELCRVCQQMYVLSDKEHETTKDAGQFCVRLMQVKQCLNTLRNERIACSMFFNRLFFTTGVHIQMRRNSCATRNVTAGDLQNIFVETRKRNTERNNKNKIVEASIGRTCRYRDHKLINGTMGNHAHGDEKPRHAHCGLFGDPHLKTFFGSRQTCVVEGNWVLVDNEFMKVEVTNKMVQNLEVPRATATKKISITFKERDLVCSGEKSYTATTQYLPEAFDDGSRTNGPRGCLSTITKQNQDSVTIKSCRSNTTVIVRRIGDYLTFNIKSPWHLANTSSGLCHSGCPAVELVDYSSFFLNRIHQNDVLSSEDESDNTAGNHLLSRPRYLTHYQAMELCARKNVTDFYYDSCVFDLLTTGKRQFSVAAKLAMQDALSMDPSLRLRRDNSFVLKAMQQQQQTSQLSSSSSSSSCFARKLDLSLALVVLIATWCVLLSHS